jgi:hypothetical protein
VGLLLHAITTAPESAFSPSGLRDCPVIRVDAGGLTVWATDLPDDSAPFTKDDVLQAHRVVSELFARVAACLPARFPTQFPDRDSLLSHVGSRREALARQLEHVRDACELAVTAVWDPPLQESTEPVTSAPTSPGRRYLLARQIAFSGSERRHRRARELAEAIERALGPLVLDSRRHVCPSSSVALSLALLVKRDQLPIARQRIPRAQADVRILVNGPWPPYTFAGAGPDQRDG